MPTLTDQGLLLQKFAYRDTSLIAVWFTRHHGRVKTIWKGARGGKSPFHGRIDFFHQASISWKPSRTSEIHTGTEILVESLHARIARDYPSATAGLYFAELILMLTAGEDPAPALFELLGKAWAYLDGHPPTPLLVARFERALAVALGFALESTPSVRVRRILDEQTGRPPHSREPLDALLRPAANR